jgi:hypothetical protein
MESTEYIKENLQTLLNIAQEDDLSVYPGKSSAPVFDIKIVSLDPFITEYSNKQCPPNLEAFGNMSEEDLNVRFGELLYSIFATLLKNGNNRFIKRVRIEFNDFRQ